MRKKTPAETAFDVIARVMQEGSSKDGSNDTWRDKDIRMHLLKSIRHCSTALLLLDGHVNDGETAIEHLDRAMTRAAMARSMLL